MLKAILLQPCIRAALKSELGAFYPLLVLRPLESDVKDAHQVSHVLKLLKKVSSDPQLLVELFVN